MSEIAFFDTNILVYMFDAGAPSKQQKAREFDSVFSISP